MLKEAVNELDLRLTLEAVSPWLIKDGRITEDVRKSMQDDLRGIQGDDKKADEAQKRLPNTLPLTQSSLMDVKAALLRHAKATSGDLSGIRSLRHFVPGSSLRGAWRSHLEMVLRSAHGLEESRVCDPLADAGPWRSCSDETEATKESRPVEVPYRHSCPICRLFGSTQQAGRIHIGDGRPVGPVAIGQRDHVAIDRKTGGPAQGKLFQEIVIEGMTVEVEVRIRNFEMFQLYLVALLVEELEQGKVAAGSGKSRGYGRSKLTKGSVTVRRYQLGQPANEWTGVGEQKGDAFASRYGLRPWAHRPAMAGGQWQRSTGWTWQRSLLVTDFRKEVLTAEAHAEALASLDQAPKLGERFAQAGGGGA